MRMGCDMAQSFEHEHWPPIPLSWHGKAYCRMCGLTIQGRFQVKAQAERFVAAMQSLHHSTPGAHDPFFCLEVFEVYEVQP